LKFCKLSLPNMVANHEQLNKKWRIEDAPFGERSNYNACSTARPVQLDQYC
jgi:hypothetical protein